MGETRDWLEAHGGPGMILCSQSGTFVHSRCEEGCGKCMAENPDGSCAECEAECIAFEDLPEDDSEPEDTRLHNDCDGGSCRACADDEQNTTEAVAQRIKYEQLAKRLAHITQLADKELQLLPLDTEPVTVERRRFICAQRDIRHALEHWNYSLEAPLTKEEYASMLMMLAGDLIATSLLQTVDTHSMVERRTALMRGLSIIFQKLIRQKLIPPDGTPPPQSRILDSNGNPFRRS